MMLNATQLMINNEQLMMYDVVGAKWYMTSLLLVKMKKHET